MIKDPLIQPPLHLNRFPGMPFRRTEEDPEERISLIQEIHLSEKPLSFMTCSVTSCQFYQNPFQNPIPA